MATKQLFDISPIISGNTWKGIQFTLPVGDAYDLTDADIHLQVRTSEVKGQLAIQFSSHNGGIIVTLPNIITIPSRIISLPASTYYWELKITFADGRVRTYIGGKWTIHPKIAS